MSQTQKHQHVPALGWAVVKARLALRDQSDTSHG